MHVKNKIPVQLQDVFEHTSKLKSNILRQSIEHNRNDSLQYAFNNFTIAIEKIEKIIRSYDNQNFKNLSNQINKTFLSDPELHGINIFIGKEKFLPNINFAKTALIKIYI